MTEEPRRIYAGETGRKYRCLHCGESSKWERDVDSRTVKTERVEGGVLISDLVGIPSDLDPPLLPTTYRCGLCGDEHPKLPDD
jgi:DNA-directed RNA polymerase subunit RPC12/RpoP